jgi:hypothetical protein
VALFARPEVGFVYGDFVALLPDGSRSGPRLRREQLISGPILRALVDNMFVHPSTLIVRRRWLERAGLLDEQECAGEHYHLLLLLSLMTEAASVAEPVACVRQHAGQISSHLGAARNFGSGIVALERYVMAHRAVPRTIRRAARRTIARFHAEIALASIDAGQPRDAWRQLARAFRRYPFSRPAWGTTRRACAAMFVRD